MRAHFLQYIFLFLLVHNSEFLENPIKSYCTRIPDHMFMWSSAQWVKRKAESKAELTVSIYTPITAICFSTYYSFRISRHQNFVIRDVSGHGRLQPDHYVVGLAAVIYPYTCVMHGIRRRQCNRIFFCGEISAFFAKIYFKISVVILNSSLYTTKYSNLILIFR